MSGSKKATLTDVARRAGVSVTTASYILNGRSSQMRISAGTERKVRKAMADLGYRPNRSARNLRRASTQTIGVISDFVATGSFSSRLLTGASAAARECDHLLVIGETLGDPEVERLLIEEMVDRQVDGIVYATVRASVVRVPEPLRDVRTVLLNCVDAEGRHPAVVPDDRGAGRLAVEHLLAAGVPGPIHVVGEDPTPEATAGPARLEGIVGALDDAGRSLAGVVSCAWDVDGSFRATDSWLREGDRPCALICMNDRVAMGVYQALTRHGLRVPDDVSVISFDGSELAGWLHPRLTSLALPFADMGRCAVDVLMRNASQTEGVVRLPLQLQCGASVPRGGPA